MLPGTSNMPMTLDLVHFVCIGSLSSYPVLLDYSRHDDVKEEKYEKNVSKLNRNNPYQY